MRAYLAGLLGALTALALVGALALGRCGGDPATPAATPPTGVPASMPAASPAASPRLLTPACHPPECR
jgi:hypothetical protein